MCSLMMVLEEEKNYEHGGVIFYCKASTVHGLSDRDKNKEL